MSSLRFNMLGMCARVTLRVCVSMCMCVCVCVIKLCLSFTSFMTGRRPHHTLVFDNDQSFRQVGTDADGKPGSNWTTLPQHFKKNGYLTLGGGPSARAHAAHCRGYCLVFVRSCVCACTLCLLREPAWQR